STAGTVRYVVDQMRAQGKKVGAVKVRMFRPFPSEDMAKFLKGKKAVAVLDRAMSPGTGAPLYMDVQASVSRMKDAPVISNYVYGLGGRDIMPGQLNTVFEEIMTGKGERVNYLGVRL
ncbi:MAG TPA: pyruvate ferredoxin oxidoreductase, partial [Methanomassiliicoccales archaeon]|nr:pyruvate ferredoxin oxidoreductase [Methanomassiliicoccales archaeon]